LNLACCWDDLSGCFVGGAGFESRGGPGAVQPQNPTLSNRNAKGWIIETLGVER
jgi:hypothetical protein